ncbi:sel1 repeat family protein [Caballeronia cordobensis]|uniref:SEL1-like repeat protein n=1 Tax=Caballeronia cordobensis TaxID=1353886 RepID=UPI0005EEB81E
MKNVVLVFLAIVSLVACSKENSLPNISSVTQMRTNLAFTCSREADRLPALDPVADSLFRYGRYLQTRDGPKNFDEVARYFRVAAAHGHYMANHNVQQLISHGLANSPDAAREAIDWATQLVNQEIPTGYYDIGYYLNSGYGLKQNQEMALKYIRKAADLGNPDAQYYISDLLFRYAREPEISHQMLRCAADQGHQKAGFEAAINLKNRKKFLEAAQMYQKAAASGSSVSAMVLHDAFLAPLASDEGYFLDLSKDQERSRRYSAIEKFLDDNEQSNPKVPDIDKIVPLPPAKLPAWDGTFEWERARAQIPPKPSDELIERLAKEKHLDPATGLPLSEQQKSAAAPKVPLETTVRVLEECPQAGVWQACPPSGYVAIPAERTFRKGEKLPLIDVEKPRAIALLDDMLGARRTHTDGMWRLIAYSEEG